MPRKKKAPPVVADTDVVQIPVELLDENPDNEKIYNMDDIDRLARILDENGFNSVVEVFPKDDGRYEITSGHRRVRAAKLNGMDTVRCIINNKPDDIEKAKKLLDSNLANRNKRPLDYAREIEYYINNVLIPSGVDEKYHTAEAAKYFNMSTSGIYRLRHIMQMIPELQEMANDPRFPYTAFAAAHNLSEEMQKELYNIILSYGKNHKDADGRPLEVSRSFIETEIRRLVMMKERKEARIEAEKRAAEREKEMEAEAEEGFEKGRGFGSGVKEADGMVVPFGADGIPSAFADDDAFPVEAASASDPFFPPTADENGFMPLTGHYTPLEELEMDEAFDAVKRYLLATKKKLRKMKKNEKKNLSYRLLEVEHDTRAILDAIGM